MGAKKVNNNIIIDAELNLLGKKIKKRNFINYEVRNNSNK